MAAVNTLSINWNMPYELLLFRVFYFFNSPVQTLKQWFYTFKAFMKIFKKHAKR